MSSDEEAQRRRAEELREEIARVKSGDESEDDSGEGEGEHESPREFIERKMREEDEQQKKKGE